MRTADQLFAGFGVALLAFNISKIHITMETILIVILAVALGVSLWFNYRLYYTVRAYQRAIYDLSRKAPLYLAAVVFAGLFVGKIIGSRLAENGDE